MTRARCMHRIKFTNTKPVCRLWSAPGSVLCAGHKKLALERVKAMIWGRSAATSARASGLKTTHEGEE